MWHNLGVKLFDGKNEAQKLEAQITEYKHDSKALAIVLIGDNPASAKYVQLKMAFSQRTGVPAILHTIDQAEDDNNLQTSILNICTSTANSSVIIQLPLPRPELMPLLDILPVQKDVDVLSTRARQNYFAGKSGIIPPVVRAFTHYLSTGHLELKNKKVLLVGHGFLVGQVLEAYCQRMGATVEIFDDKTTDVATRKLSADVVVLSTGVAGLIKGEQLAEGTHVVDFGYPGDLDMKSKLDHLGLVSPAVGGMGPLVICYLFMNHLRI